MCCAYISDYTTYVLWSECHIQSSSYLQHFHVSYMCGTFGQLYLLHMYSVVYIDKYVFSCGAASEWD